MMQDDFQTHLLRQKLDAMKELAYGASHEINNPLANIAARAQALLRDEDNQERRRALLAIHKQTLRAHEMISDLMLFARPPALKIEKLDVRALIECVIDELADQCQQQNITLACTWPKETVEIHADAEQLAVAIKALCTNSLEAIGLNGEVVVTLRYDQPSEASDELCCSRIVIEIVDNGPGISDEVRAHLFDPFYSGREAGRGLGFGLSKCWRIITEHGGDVNVASRLGQGAIFTISLPADAPATAH